MSLLPKVCLLLPVMAAGCADDADLPPIVWEGEHLRFGSDEDLGGVCAGTLPHSDDVVAYLAGIFNRTDPHVDFYWFPDGLERPCDEDWVGCAVDGTIFSQEVLLDHEIVHAVRGTSATSALEEGVAELFGDDWTPTYPLKGSTRLMFEHHDGAAVLEGGWYPLAGWFASFLRAAYGSELLLRFADESRRQDSWAQTQVLFEGVYGFPMEVAFQDHEENYPGCDQTEYRDNGFECLQPAISLPTGEAGAIEIPVPLDCDDASVLGPRQGERWTTIAIEVQSDAHFYFGIDKVGGSADGRVRLRQCGQSCFTRDDPTAFVLDMDVAAQAEPSVGFEGYDRLVCISAGRYTVRLAVDEDDDGDFIVRFQHDREQACAG